MLMKIGSINSIYIKTKTGEFKKYFIQGIKGIILAACIICCFIVAENFELHNKEAAVSSYVPGKRIDIDILNPDIVADILNKNPNRSADHEKALSDKNLEVPKTDITEIIIEETVVTEIKEEYEKILPADPNSTVTEPSDQVVDQPTIPNKDPEPVMPFTYTGALPMDYCVGSEAAIDNISLFWMGKQVQLEDCEVGTIDTSEPGAKILTITYNGEQLGIPYGVMEYTVVLNGNGGTVSENLISLWNYKMDTDNIDIPLRLGKEFTGWYSDPECTVPFEEVRQGEYQTVAYAGWKDFDHFISDDAGNLTAFVGDPSVFAAGILRVPVHESCVGISETAFSALGSGSGIVDAYIPANILYIAPHAFDMLTELMYIEVAADNPNYCSIGGEIYTKDGSELIASPKGWEMFW